MNVFERTHFLHRAWRYRLHSDKFGVSFLLSRELTGATTVDVGANRGIYSYWMHKKVGQEGTVVAFEPQPELNLQLNRLKSAFNLKRLEIAGLGLSSAEQERQLMRPRNHWGGASLEVAPNAESDVMNVQLTTLDVYFRDHSGRPVSFIKCDVEGHEFDVFQGGRQILQEDRPDLLIECHTPENPHCKVFSYLSELGYAGFCFLTRGYAPISKYNELRESLHRKALLNFAFVPEERSHALTNR
jgi:FkbM family methyltransferase